MNVEIFLLSSTVLVLGIFACDAPQPPSRDFEGQRRVMVEHQLRARDVRSERVLEAMRKVPRHLFIPEGQRHDAYGDYPVPIGHGQTISQPYIVGFMTQALEVGPTDRVLEIGTGSGYQAAVLGELVKEDHDRNRAAAESACVTLARGHRNARARRQRLPGWMSSAVRSRDRHAAPARCWPRSSSSWRWHHGQPCGRCGRNCASCARPRKGSARSRRLGMVRADDGEAEEIGSHSVLNPNPRARTRIISAVA
jgi:hypothetical protein